MTRGLRRELEQPPRRKRRPIRWVTGSFRLPPVQPLCSRAERGRRALQLARDDPRGWGIPLPSIAEFWHVVTHPRVAAKPSNARAAIHFLRSVTEEGAAVWTLRAGSWERLLQLAVDQGISLLEQGGLKRLSRRLPF